MKVSILVGTLLASLCILAYSPVSDPTVYGRDVERLQARDPNVYVELSEGFYEALRREAQEGARVYTNDPSTEYLKEIAVSTRFMVQTNLEILRGQEEMNRMLRRLLERK